MLGNTSHDLPQFRLRRVISSQQFCQDSQQLTILKRSIMSNMIPGNLLIMTRRFGKICRINIQGKKKAPSKKMKMEEIISRNL
jgi:hypothetical protein